MRMHCSVGANNVGSSDVSVWEFDENDGMPDRMIVCGSLKKHLGHEDAIQITFHDGVELLHHLENHRLQNDKVPQSVIDYVVAQLRERAPQESFDKHFGR